MPTTLPKRKRADARPTGVRLELSTSCTGCRGKMPVLAVVDRVTCPACGQLDQLGAAFWDQALTREPTLVSGRAGRSIHAELGEPACPACGSDLDVGALDDASGGALACPSCAAEVVLRDLRVEPGFALPVYAKLAVGEDRAQREGEPTTATEGSLFVTYDPVALAAEARLDLKVIVWLLAQFFVLAALLITVIAVASGGFSPEMMPLAVLAAPLDALIYRATREPLRRFLR